MKSRKDLLNQKEQLEFELSEVMDQLAQTSDTTDKSLEEQFRMEAEKTNKYIQNFISIAEFNLKCAMNVSEETGIPFKASIRTISQKYRYIPTSFTEKWGWIVNSDNYDAILWDLDWEDLNSRLGDEEGWQSSRIC